MTDFAKPNFGRHEFVTVRHDCRINSLDDVVDHPRLQDNHTQHGRFVVNKWRKLTIYQEIPEIPGGTLMAHRFSGRSTGKFPGIRGIFEKVVLLSRWKYREVWRHVTMVALFLDDNKTNDDGDGKENGKKWYVYINKQQLCTCITLFCTFLCRRCTTTTWNFLISRARFME